MKQKTSKPEPKSAESPDSETVLSIFNFGLQVRYGKHPEDLSEGDQRLLNALRLYYAYRHNGFLLIEALELCTRNNVHPPPWILESLNKGLQKLASGKVTIRLALNISERHRQEYDQYRGEHKSMREVRNLIAGGSKISPACKEIANRQKGLIPETVEKRYRRFWRGFFDYAEGPIRS